MLFKRGVLVAISKHFSMQDYEAFGHKKSLVCAEVKSVLPDGKDEPILDVAAGTGIIGKLVRSFNRFCYTCFPFLL